MPTERILIKPDLFQIKDSSEKVVFSSNNRYLRTDSNGIFPAGGNVPAPLFFGVGANSQGQYYLPNDTYRLLDPKFRLGSIFIDRIVSTGTMLETEAPAVSKIVFAETAQGTSGYDIGYTNETNSLPILIDTTTVGHIRYRYTRLYYAGTTQGYSLRLDGLTVTNLNNPYVGQLDSTYSPIVAIGGTLKIPLPRNTGFVYTGPYPDAGWYFMNMKVIIYGENPPKNLSLSGTA